MNHLSEEVGVRIDMSEKQFHSSSVCYLCQKIENLYILTAGELEDG